jgi:hypothetical protein
MAVEVALMEAEAEAVILAVELAVVIVTVPEEVVDLLIMELIKLTHQV